MSIVNQLGEFSAGLKFKDLPPEVILECKNRIADLVGIALSGSTTAVGQRAREYAAYAGRPGKGLIWGSGKRTTPAYASMANATATFSLELDDVHRTSHTHPGATIIPAVIALAEEYGYSGQEVITAIVAGFDVQIRIGLGVSPSIYTDTVLLAPATLAAPGTAAASAKIMGLDAKGIAGAIASATYLGSIAPFESFRKGAAVKEYIFGWANLNGISCAELAARGSLGIETALEGDFGYCKAVSTRYDLDRITDGLGTHFEIVNTGTKPYACCRQIHAAIDAIFELREKYTLKPEEIERIHVRTFSVASRTTGKNFHSIAAAKYSTPYTMAVCLLFGEAWREQYTEELLTDPRIAEIAEKVDVTMDPELEALYDIKWPAIVEVTTKDGRKLTSRHDLMKGEPEKPLTAEELKKKFMSLAQDTVSAERAQEIWEHIYDLENLDDIGELTALLIV